jgi:VanZ family protein
MICCCVISLVVCMITLQPFVGMVSAVLIGILKELLDELQFFRGHGRFDVTDLVADLIGAAVGMLLGGIYVTLRGGS